LGHKRGETFPPNVKLIDENSAPFICRVGLDWPRSDSSIHSLLDVLIQAFCHSSITSRHLLSLSHHFDFILMQFLPLFFQDQTAQWWRRKSKTCRLFWILRQT
jgi:hypothetical protein